METIQYKGWTIQEASDWSKKIGVNVEYFFQGDKTKFADSIEEAKVDIDSRTRPEELDDMASESIVCELNFQYQQIGRQGHEVNAKQLRYIMSLEKELVRRRIISIIGKDSFEKLADKL